MCKLLTFPHFPSVGKLKTIFKIIFKTIFKIIFKTIFPFGIGLQDVDFLVACLTACIESRAALGCNSIIGSPFPYPEFDLTSWQGDLLAVTL